MKPSETIKDAVAGGNTRTVSNHIQEVTFNCEVISPMFIGNASTHGCELRPSAIKASMRFWWRAIHPNLSAKDLRIKECELFGGSYIPGKKQKTNNNPPKFRFLEFTTNLNIANQRVDCRPTERREKKAILPKSAFTITLLCKESDVKTIIALVYLASALGGLGKSSRRGSGAWKITSYKTKIPQNGLELTYTIASILQAIQYLNKDVYTINNEKIVLITGKMNRATTNSDFPYLKEVCIGPEYNNHSTLISKIKGTAGGLKGKNSVTFSKSLGAIGKHRLSSPVIASMIANAGSQNVKPIISTVNHLYSQRDKNAIVDFQNRFKNTILQDA